ncbi:MAG: hypothetical protein NC548_27195 [Lachnospiraceae bacterium]|nr:hypothetical protein [Lachnospiraceae bacterium]
MLTQDDYNLYTGSNAAYPEEQWQKLVNIAASRLAGFLCLDKLPYTGGRPLTAEEYDSLKLSAKGYDGKGLTAQEYDTVASILLGTTKLVLPDDLAMLLANFIAIMIKIRGDKAQIETKKVRNFSISYAQNAGKAYAKLRQNYGDVIEKYSACCCGVYVSSTRRRYCNGCI